MLHYWRNIFAQPLSQVSTYRIVAELDGAEAAVSVVLAGALVVVEVCAVGGELVVAVVAVAIVLAIEALIASILSLRIRVLVSSNRIWVQI